MTEREVQTSQPVFRPSKRRKVIRRRRAPHSDDEQASHGNQLVHEKAANSGTAGSREGSDNDGVAVLQKIRKP
jgi:hypothetical protein